MLHELTDGKPLALGEFAWYGGGAITANGKEVLPAKTVEHQAARGQGLLDVTASRMDRKAMLTDAEAGDAFRASPAKVVASGPVGT